MAQHSQREATADLNVARALSVAQTLIDAGPAGLTKAQLRERVEQYRYSAGQSDAAFDKQFERDKAALRESGIPLPEHDGVSEDTYRYTIRETDYGLPELHLTPGERIALHRAQLSFAHSNLPGLEHALWATAGSRAPEGGVPPGSLQASIGSETEITQLLGLTERGLRTPVVFDYIGHGRMTPHRRRVITLGTGASGHWYLIGHDLDRGELRTFRLDRIHGTIGPMKPVSADAQAAVEDIEAGRLYADLNIAAVVESLPQGQAHRAVLEGAATAHSQPATVPPRLRQVTATRSTGNASAKVDRVLNMAALLLASAEGVPPSALMDTHDVTPYQLQRDLLSLQQAGSFDADVFGRFTEVYPAPPVTLEDFDDYLAADQPITLELPGARAEELMDRPVSLTKAGALGLMIALKTLAEAAHPGEEAIAEAAGSLQQKVAQIVPAGIREAAAAMALRHSTADGSRLRAVQQAISAGCALQLSYEDSTGTLTDRQIEPVQVVYDGPRTYLRAWCRSAEAPRFFKLSRIRQLTTLVDSPRGEQAADLALSGAAAPRVARTEESLDVVLRFAPPALGLVEQFGPERQASEESGARVIATHFRTEETAVRRVIEAGGDIELLTPEYLRSEILRRCRHQLQQPAGTETGPPPRVSA